MKHTSAPWKMVRSKDTYTDVHGEDFTVHLCGIESSNGVTVVSDEYGIKETDMLLMAAAPEMLETLKGVLEYLESVGGEPSDPEVQAAFSIKRVIAKAEGRS